DGFHEIVSAAVPIRLFDTLLFESADDPQIRLVCTGGGTDVPADDSNIAVKAAKLLQKKGNVLKGAVIHLMKRIPSQAGFGGGSSDAAAVLRLANRCWNVNLSDSELLPLAAEIGSDCPIFFYKTPTISTGRGERIEPLPAVPPLHLVIVKPEEGLSTAAVYAECMPNHDRQFRSPQKLITALSSGNAEEIGQHLFNRLEESAQKIWQGGSEIKNRLLASGCLAAQMSGSGTAFFGLCRNQKHAEEIQQQFGSGCRTMETYS
ncbi:MAG: 4-(cytidine 5'-diphospho)-2-C-methyl-D-erythritol kinase, partial [Planctomycetaceae bacterium]|nr:4-(cytidine 5'-diphospho)-2-C-methyl-D-erythritol kinase [Planctomycetaceae bacterium]